MSFYSMLPLYLMLSFLSSLTQSCGEADRETAGLQKITQLPKEVKESSGLAPAGKTGEYFTHRDAGGKPVLFRINADGKLLDSHTIPGTRNVDWEDLAHDAQGNLYVGDFGNNDNARQDLVIYKLASGDLTQPASIRFRYEDQEDFPPSKKGRDFDCEAFVWQEGKLFLFTKNRGSKKGTDVYVLPDQPGEHVARKVGSLRTDEVITGADLSTDGPQLALVSNDNLYLFAVNGLESASLAEAKRTKLPLPGTGQTEAVVYENASSLLLTDEEGGLYRYTLGEK